MCEDIGGVILAGSDFWGGHDPRANCAPGGGHVLGRDVSSAERDK